MHDPTFLYRVAFGLTLFGLLGAVDWIRHPNNPKRLKEYVFLFGVTAVVMLYGVVHDAVTYTLSPDYFRLVKGLSSESLFPDVARLALMASWTVGLAIGLAMLVANNPSRRFEQLPYVHLVRHLTPMVASPVLGVVFGCVASLCESNELPRDVVSVWAVHIGTYIGAAFGLLITVWRIRRARSSLARKARQRKPFRARFRSVRDCDGD